MKSYDAGHVETQVVLPEPLAGTALWNLGTFALPSTMLSIASAAVFATVWGFLQLGGAEQELFVLPPPYTSIIGLVAAALGWLIAVRCRRRPGRIGPRIWTLVLASLSSAIALLAFFLHDRSWLLALAVAALAAAATLAPRLAKLRPNNPMVQHIAPLSLLMILLVILPSSCAVRRVIAKGTERRVDRRIRQFKAWTAEVSEITSFDWSRIEDSPAAAAGEIQKLENLSFKAERNDAEIWRSAAILGKDGDLAAAMQGLTARVVAGFDPARSPRVSQFKEPALHWDEQDKRWKAYGQFPKLSEIAGSYHQELGRLFTELRDVPSEGARSPEYRQHYAAQRRLLREHLIELANSWPDNWAAFRVPQHEELIGRTETSLNELLQASFINDGETSFAPGDLWQLTSLPLYRLKSLAAGAAARGCHSQNFEEGRHQYFRLDCYSYAPRKEGMGAELRVEMRVVYESAARKRLGAGSLPSEIYFHFLIPEGVESGPFSDAVMNDLAVAARHSSPGTDPRPVGRSGSFAGGFTIGGYGEAVRVYRPVVVPLNGLTPELQAVMIRAVRSR
jgi:hypothetical protein